VAADRRQLVDAAERAVLGSILLHPRAIPEAVQHLTGADFADPKHEHVFNAAATLHTRGIIPTLTTVYGELTRLDLMSSSLTLDYITKLPDDACLWDQVFHHAEIITTEAGRRTLQGKLRSAMQALDVTEGDDLPLVAKEMAERFLDVAEPRNTTGPTVDAQQFPSIKWADAFATDFSDVDWMPGRFLERGQQAAIVGGGKVGKSLFLLDWIYRCVTGRRFLADERHDPVSVLYFDRENNLRDIITRMKAFGAAPDDLVFLDYRMFPGFAGALDESERAVAELMAIVDEAKPDIVVFDTVSRFIGGKENDSDTWLSFYRRVHAPLKQRGVCGVRIDHMGKDEERGSRGSSAKTQDVDHVWELTRQGERIVCDADGIETVTTELRMHRTHSRTGLGQDNFFVTRRARREQGGMWLPGCTAHELSDPGPQQDHERTVARYVDALVAKGAPGGMGREKMREWAVANGVELPGRMNVLADIARALKAAREG